MKKKEKNIPLFVSITVFLLVVIIGYYFYNKDNENYNYLKIDKSKYLIYTISKKKSGNYNQYKPYLNINSEMAGYINEDIDLYINSFDKENVCITYETDLNGKILSLIIKVEDYSFAESAVVLSFRSYNLKLDTMELLSKDEVLNYFEMTEDDVILKLEEKIIDYYNKLIDKGTINERECNYNCFLKARNFGSSAEDNEYFIRDGKLIVFKPFIYMTSDSDKKTKKYYFKI